MAIQLQGSSTNPMELGGMTYKALRVQQMPIDYGTNGSYKAVANSGTIAAGIVAGSEVFQFRWTSSSVLAVIQRVVIDNIMVSSTGFTAGFGNLGLYMARSFTASGSGGTALTAANVTKLKTNMATSVVGDFRYASTGALTAGTETVDTDPIAQYGFAVSTTANIALASVIPLVGQDTSDGNPLVLTQNEGFVIKATMPATGTWLFSLSVTWTEVSSY